MSTLLKEKESLEKENNSLRNEFSFSKKRTVDLEKLTSMKEEKKKVSSLTKDLAKFEKGKENIDFILGAQNAPWIKEAWDIQNQIVKNITRIFS